MTNFPRAIVSKEGDGVEIIIRNKADVQQASDACATCPARRSAGLTTFGEMNTTCTGVNQQTGVAMLQTRATTRGIVVMDSGLHGRKVSSQTACRVNPFGGHGDKIGG